MKHYELLRLKPAADADAVRHKIWKAYDKLDAELDWLNHPVVIRGCLAGEDRADIMATFELDGEEYLAGYLEHPRRKKLAEELEPLIDARIAFDHY